MSIVLKRLTPAELHLGANHYSSFFFSIHIRNYIHKLQIDKLLYNTTMTIPGGAKYHDYPSGRKRSEVHSLVQFVTHLSIGFSTRGVP